MPKIAFFFSVLKFCGLAFSSSWKERKRKREVYHATALSFSAVFAVFLALSLGNTSNTMRNATAVGGECPVLNGTHSVTLSGVECLHTSYATYRGSTGNQVRVCNDLPSSLSCILCSKFILCLLPLANKRLFAAAWQKFCHCTERFHYWVH